MSIKHDAEMALLKVHVTSVDGSGSGPLLSGEEARSPSADIGDATGTLFRVDANDHARADKGVPGVSSEFVAVGNTTVETGSTTSTHYNGSVCILPAVPSSSTLSCSVASMPATSQSASNATTVGLSSIQNSSLSSSSSLAPTTTTGSGSGAASSTNYAINKTHTQTLPVTPELFRGRKLRSGKWMAEEERYSMLLIEQFEKGFVTDCKNGQSLRCYLSVKLHCPPMRISKKYAGQGIGKHVYLHRERTRRDNTTAAGRPDQEALSTSLTPEQVADRDRLAALVKRAEEAFHAACYPDKPDMYGFGYAVAPTHTVSASAWIGGVHVPMTVQTSGLIPTTVAPPSHFRGAAGVVMSTTPPVLYHSSSPRGMSTGMPAPLQLHQPPPYPRAMSTSQHSSHHMLLPEALVSTMATQVPPFMPAAVSSYANTMGPPLIPNHNGTSKLAMPYVNSTKVAAGTSKHSEMLSPQNLAPSPASCKSEATVCASNRTDAAAGCAGQHTSDSGGITKALVAASAASHSPPLVLQEEGIANIKPRSSPREHSLALTAPLSCTSSLLAPSMRHFDIADMPNFVTGFDNVALSLATTAQHDNKSPLQDIDVDQHGIPQCSPPLTSRSFDDFHRLLDKDLAPLDGIGGGKERDTEAADSTVAADGMALFSAEAYALFAQEAAALAHSGLSFEPLSLENQHDGSESTKPQSKNDSSAAMTSDSSSGDQHYGSAVMESLNSSGQYNDIDLAPADHWTPVEGLYGKRNVRTVSEPSNASISVGGDYSSRQSSEECDVVSMTDSCFSKMRGPACKKNKTTHSSIP